MQLSETEIRTLNGMGDEERGNGWSPVPDSCPPQIARQIAEARAKRIGYQPQPVETREGVLREAIAEFGL